MLIKHNIKVDNVHPAYCYIGTLITPAVKGPVCRLRCASYRSLPRGTYMHVYRSINIKLHLSPNIWLQH